MYKLSVPYSAAWLVFASFATIACESDRDATAAGLTGPSATAAASVAAEPMSIAAEFRPNSSCRAGTPFDASVSITVRARREVSIRRFGFEFFDLRGRRAVPFILPGAVIDPTSSVLPPIPLPTSSPIPFPGQWTLSSVQVPTGAFHRFPFRLQFECGVEPHGTLFVSVDTLDARGTVEVARISAPIGQ